ncbi:protein irs4 [Aspergillus melleus]|uniref:protein irs4 n=1 Tax=Aspergillus melleus TaxID=138277 RepID=UPI001E8EE367|nr:Increased rDNA silencing protein [Aspergillus melleus]KAH8425335.1 Increased rDNA silencing protein [Aspergillus melleus]
MASSTSGLDPRPAAHLSRNNANHSLTALQGAVNAFHGSPSRGVSPAAIHRTAMPMDTSRGPEPHSEADTPEIGSVKDKIGRFAAQSQPPNLQTTPERNQINKTITKQRSMHQIAAQLAAEKSAMASEKRNPSPAPSMRSMQHVNRVSTMPRNQNQHVDLLTGDSMDDLTTSTSSTPSISADEQGLPSRTGSIQRKPIGETSPAVPEPIQTAVAKPRPVPPVPRKPRLATGGLNVTDTALPIRHQTRTPEPPLSSRASVRSKASSTLSDEKAPPLPARPGTWSNQGPRDHRKLLDTRDPPRRPMSPGMASVSGRSLNTSSSSLLDMDEEALSDAIVASSLASSRAPPPRKVPPTPPPQRRPRSRSILRLQHSGRSEHSISSSPPGTMRHTLRDAAKSDDEEAHTQRHRKHLVRKHPHKHHEGDRKRWRSEITEKERKRYEGVWAANKGLYVTPSLLDQQTAQQDQASDGYPANASDMVVNVVVRDIWSRSRLPAVNLEQIWDLVDHQKIGILKRDEFVVGMWLIDQQLKGHKLPPKVPDSVWYSVRRVPGVTLSQQSLI